MINNIQILRAFAAVNVVLFHIIGAAASYKQGVVVFRFLDGWGANGVDVFFVISGFVMQHVQFSGERSPASFLKGRLVRIVPMYWLVTLTVTLLYVLMPNSFRGMAVTPSWVGSSLIFMSSLFSFGTPVVHVGWTLEWEILFYLVFSVGLLVKPLWASVWLVTILLFGVSYASGNLIVFEFFFGMLIACFYRTVVVSKKVGVVIWVFGLTLLCSSLFPIVRAFGFDRLFVWGIPSLIIVFGAVYAPQMKNGFLLYLGEASYSIYLVQILTIPAFYKFSSVFLVGWPGDVLGVVCLIFCVGFGCMIHSVVEKRLTLRVKRMLAS